MSDTSWIVQIDPDAIAPDRTMLDLNNGPIQVGATDGSLGIDWGTSAITEYATQQGAYGNSVADFVIPNRTITINLIIGGTGYEEDEETARAELAMKVALLQREGGQLLRQRESGMAMYADIVDAQLTIPDQYGETGEVEPNVQLVLTCLPDFYGDEVTLDTIHCTGVCSGVLSLSGAQADIEGDYPARVRAIITDASGNNQNSALWGFRSRYYSSASTSALFYEAEALTPLNGAAVTTQTGASSGHDIQLSSMMAGTLIPMLSTEIASSSAQMTHQGSYRVWARAAVITGQVSLQLVWGVGSLSVPATNDLVEVPPDGFYLVDLGTIRLDAPPTGTNEWIGVVQAMTGLVNSAAAIDCLYFQPLDEAAGQLLYTLVPPANVLAISANAGAGANVTGPGSSAWNNSSEITSLGTGSTTASDTYVNLTSSGQISDFLEATDFGLAIPSGATIQGIEFTVSHLVTYVGGIAQYAYDYEVSILKAGSAVGTNHASATPWSLSGRYSNVTYGGPNDLWGTTWTSAQINASTFGLALSVQNLGVNIGAWVQGYVTATIYCTFASGFAIAQDAVVYANQATEIRYDGMYRTPGSSVYGPVSQVTGDLARLPPSGVEDRAVQVFAKPSRGDLNSLADAGLDAFTVQVIYRPTWLDRP